MSLLILLGGVAILIVVVGVFGVAVVLRSKSSLARLPYAPTLRAQPVADLAKYYELREPALGWEKVRGWELNQTPAALDAPFAQALYDAMGRARRTGAA